MDSRFRGNDESGCFLTFYRTIKFEVHIFRPNGIAYF